MIDVLTMPEGESIYTFVGDDGENVHIACNRLRLWCREARPEIFRCPIDRALAETFVRDNVISMERVKQMAGMTDLDPMIFCKTGTFDDGVNPDVLLVDGHHRYYTQRNQEFGLGHVLEVIQWKPFQVVGIPPTTKAALLEMEILKRKYWEP